MARRPTITGSIKKRLEEAAEERQERLRTVAEKQDQIAETRETINEDLEKLKGGEQGEGEDDTRTESQRSQFTADRNFNDDEDKDTETDDSQDIDDPGLANDDIGNDLEEGDTENDEDDFADDLVSGPVALPGNTSGQQLAEKQGPERTGALQYMKQVRKDVIIATLRDFWQSNGAWDLTLLTALTTTVGAGQIATAVIERVYDDTFGAKAKERRITNAITERRGVDKIREYSRAFNEVEYRMGQGDTHMEAMMAGARRLSTMVATDLQLAKTKTAQQSYKDSPHINRYRRVPGGDNPCPLCLLASAQIYYKEDLLPIHPNCECDVEPLEDNVDPRSLIYIPRSYLVGDTSTVNPDGSIDVPGSARRGGNAKRASDIRRYLKSIADQYGQIYEDEPGDEPIKDLSELITVHEHGEIGPVLSYAGQQFRGPDDLPHRPNGKMALQPSALMAMDAALPPGVRAARRMAKKAVTKVSKRATAVATERDRKAAQDISGQVRRLGLPPEQAEKFQAALDRDFNIWLTNNPPPEGLDADALAMYTKRHDASADIGGYVAVRDKGFAKSNVTQIQDYLMFKHADTVGKVMDFDATGISTSAAKSVLKAADDMMTKYPDLHISRIAPNYMQDLRIIAQTQGSNSIPGNTTSIVVNRDLMSSRTGAQKEFKSHAQVAVDNKWFFPNQEKDPWRAAFVHEYGHALDNRSTYNASKSLNSVAIQLFKSQHPELHGAWDAQMYKDWMNSEHRISGYSLNQPNNHRGTGSSNYFLDVSLNNKEALAQAFDDVERNGDKASDLSKRIHDVIMEEYAKPMGKEWPTVPDDGSNLKTAKDLVANRAAQIKDQVAQKVTKAKADAEAHIARHNEQLEKDAYETIRRNGGVTIDLAGHSPAKGYAFAPYKGTETVVPEKEFTPAHLDKFIDEHFDELRQKGNNLGVWTADGNVYMDISRVGPASAATIAKAQAADQLAVFDLEHFNEIETGTITDGKYTPIGKAADVHRQYRAKVAGTDEKRSAASTPEVPAGEADKLAVKAAKDAAKAEKAAQRAEAERLAAVEKAKGFGLVQARIKDGTEVKPVYALEKDGKTVKMAQVKDPKTKKGVVDAQGNPVMKPVVDIKATWASISDDTLKENWRKAIRQSLPWAQEAGKVWYPEVNRWANYMIGKYGADFKAKWGMELTPDLMASFIASYSENNSWAGNLLGIRKFLDGTGSIVKEVSSGEQLTHFNIDDARKNKFKNADGTAYDFHVAKAFRAMKNPEGGVADLRKFAADSPKPADFAANVAGDYTKATADRWVARIMLHAKDYEFADAMWQASQTVNKVTDRYGYKRLSAALQAVAGEPEFAYLGNAAAVQAVPWVQVVGPLGSIGYVEDLENFASIGAETVERAKAFGDVK